MNASNQEIFAIVFDGKGGGTRVGWEGIREWEESQGALWMHLERDHASARDWILQESQIGTVLGESILADETRSRLLIEQGNLLVVLRGVNMNPHADPEDMVSIRIWCEPRRIVTLSSRKVLAVGDIQLDLEKGAGPEDPAGLLVKISERLLARIDPLVSDMEEEMFTIEERFDDVRNPDIRPDLGALRRKILALHRHLLPQREVAKEMSQLKIPWVIKEHLVILKEVAHHTARVVEQLTHQRDWASLIRDEINQRLSFNLNRIMYQLTLVATFLLPLSFLTGLLGVNLGGIPGAEKPLGFLVFAGLLLLFGVGEFILLKKMKLL